MSETTILSEVNDLNRINAAGMRGAGSADPADGLRRQIESIRKGGWDAAEYGISAEAQVAKLEAALAESLSPEGREKAAEIIAAAMEEMKERAIRRANLDTSTGKVAVFVAGKEPAWHRLGKHVAEAQSSAEAMHLAEQDWQVGLWDSPAVDPVTGLVIKDPLARKIVRLDTKTVLGTVGTVYRPLQNVEAYEFMDGLVGERLAMYESAGCIDGGRKVWMLARIPMTLRVNGSDETIPYVLLSNCHDGSGAVRVLPTTVRVECGNTMNLAIGKAGKEQTLAIRHCSSMKGKVNEARTKLGIVVKRLEDFQQQMDALAAVSLKETKVVEYFEQWFPRKVRPAKKATGANGTGHGDGASLLMNMLEGGQQKGEIVAELLKGHFADTERQAKRNAKIMEQILENFSEDTARGTAWGAFNAVTEFIDWGMTHRGKTDAERDNARLNSVWFGRGNEIKQEAFQEALKFVK